MKHILLFILFIMISSLNYPACSQQADWVVQTDGLSGEQGGKICLDGKGNVYASGTAGGNAMVGNYSITKGDFVAKFSEKGDCIWAKNIAGTIADIESDPSGNVYVTGTFTNAAAFGKFSLTGSGLKDIYLVKLDSNGIEIWANKAGSKKEDEPVAMAVDDQENIYLTGSFGDTAYFDTIRVIKRPGGNIFCTKYDSKGIALWVQQGHAVPPTPASNDSYLHPKDILINGQKIYLVCTYTGNIIISDTGFYAYYTNVLFVSYTSAGQRKSIIEKGYDKGTDITGAFFHAQQLYWSGNTGSQYGHGEHVYKHDSLMNIMWNINLCHPNWCNTSVRSSGADKEGNLYTVCNYKEYDTYDMDYKANWIPSKGLTDFFLVKYDAAGTLQWKKNFGNKGDDVSKNMVVDPFGNCFITGYFTDELKLDSFTLHSSNSVSHFFVAKINKDIFTGISYSPNDMEDIERVSVYPNPADGTFTVSMAGMKKNKLSLNIKNGLGQLIYREVKKDFSGNYINTIDLSHHPKGIYFMEIVSGNERAVKKIVLQ